VLKKVIPVEDAISVLHDGDVLATTGYGGHGVPEQLLVTLEKRFVETGTPRGLTLVHSTGQGDGQDKGLNHLGHEGLLRRVIGGHFGLAPKIVQLVLTDKVEAYNLPEGVITHMYRDVAAGKPGTVSKVGLGTFVDPRIEGGKMNRVTREDLVELMTIGGEEYLFYKGTPINVAFIRGTTADPDGNITMEREALILENLAMALAAKNSHGYVICQVERVAAEGTPSTRVRCVSPACSWTRWWWRSRGITCRPGVSSTIPPSPVRSGFPRGCCPPLSSTTGRSSRVGQPWSSCRAAWSTSASASPTSWDTWPTKSGSTT